MRSVGPFGSLNALMPAWIVEQPNGDCLITVWVVPGASRTQVVGTHADALKIKVSAPPERGRANAALLRLISKRTGAATALESGAVTRRKVVRVTGCTVQEVERALSRRRAH